MAIRLDNGRQWRSADGLLRPLALMVTSHLWAVANYLRSWAPDFRSLDPITVAGTPADYLRSLPVFRGIAAELTKRHALAGDLYEAQVAQGPAPWGRLP